MSRREIRKARTGGSGNGLISLRTAVVVLLGVLGGAATGAWTGLACRSVVEGVLAGAAACAATIRFFHEFIEQI